MFAMNAKFGKQDRRRDFWSCIVLKKSKQATWHKIMDISYRCISYISFKRVWCRLRYHLSTVICRWYTPRTYERSSWHCCRRIDSLKRDDFGGNVLTVCRALCFCSSLSSAWTSCSWVWSSSFSTECIFFWQIRASSSAFSALKLASRACSWHSNAKSRALSFSNFIACTFSFMQSIALKVRSDAPSVDILCTCNISGRVDCEGFAKWCNEDIHISIRFPVLSVLGIFSFGCKYEEYVEGTDGYMYSYVYRNGSFDRKMGMGATHRYHVSLLMRPRRYSILWEINKVGRYCPPAWCNEKKKK